MRADGLLVAAKGTVLTSEESSTIPAGVAEPLAARLRGNPIYYGGSEHCGEV